MGCDVYWIKVLPELDSTGGCINSAIKTWIAQDGYEILRNKACTYVT
jgi:hypothetical protein